MLLGSSWEWGNSWEAPDDGAPRNPNMTPTHRQPCQNNDTGRFRQPTYCECGQGVQWEAPLGCSWEATGKLIHHPTYCAGQPTASQLAMTRASRGYEQQTAPHPPTHRRPAGSTGTLGTSKTLQHQKQRAHENIASVLQSQVLLAHLLCSVSHFGFTTCYYFRRVVF